MKLCKTFVNRSIIYFDADKDGLNFNQQVELAAANAFLKGDLGSHHSNVVRSALLYIRTVGELPYMDLVDCPDVIMEDKNI